MYDGVTLRIHHEDAAEKMRIQRRLRTHPELVGSWKPQGHKPERFEARWKGLRFEGDRSFCWTIRGSFHKAYQGHNASDFTQLQFLATVEELCNTFGLHDASLKLDKLEVGVNIVPPISSSDVLRAIIVSGNRAPIPYQAGNGIAIKREASTIKVYDKAADIRLRAATIKNGLVVKVVGELLRFEVSVRRMRAVAAFGVRTLADLKSQAVWDGLQSFTLEKFDELLILEPRVSREGLRRSQRDVLDQASDPSYWQKLNHHKRSRRRRTLREIYRKRASNGLAPTLRGLIQTKLMELGTVV